MKKANLLLSENEICAIIFALSSMEEKELKSLLPVNYKELAEKIANETVNQLTE